MARTKDEAAHAAKLDGFLDATATVLRDKGYDAMTIGDVIRAADASKGAFYHYFTSKEELLEALLSRMLDQITAVVSPVLDAPGLTAHQRFDGFVDAVAGWKWQRREAVIATARAWQQGGTRHRLQQEAISALAPLLAGIVRQGRSDGDFHADDPEVTARLCLVILLDLNEQVTDRFLADHPDPADIEPIKTRFAAHDRALERLLGAEPHTIRILDDRVLHAWFGQ